jgi:hypothetical protein
MFKVIDNSAVHRSRYWGLMYKVQFYLDFDIYVW